MSIKQTKTTYSHLYVGVQHSAFSALLEFSELSSEAVHLPEALVSREPEVVGVCCKVVFIDKSSGCCHRVSRAMASIVV